MHSPILTYIVSIINFLGILMGLIVFLADRKSQRNRRFAVMVLFVLLWTDFSFLGQIQSNVSKSLIWFRLNFISVSFFLLAAFYFYVEPFLNPNYLKNKITSRLVIFFSFTFATLSLTPLIVSEVVFKEQSPILILGPASYAFELYALAIGIAIIAELLKKYKAEKKGDSRSKIRFLLIGTFIFIALNIVFNVLIPIFSRTNPYPDYYWSMTLLSFTAFAILKDKLFEIRKIVIESLIISIALMALLVLILFGQFDINVPSILMTAGILAISTLAVIKIQKENEYKARLLLSTIEIRKANVKLEKNNKKLSVIQEQKSRFFADISHEFKTPLTILKGNLDVITEEMPKEEKVILLKEFARINKLTAELVELSKAESGEVKIKFSQVNIKLLFDDIVKEVQTLLKQHHVTLKTNFKNLPSIVGDRDKLHRLILNLIANAIKYNKPEGTVEVTTWKEEKYFIFQIKDTGIGISEKDLSKIFERFFRVDKKKSREMGGTGLGLSIVKLMVDIHHGSIDVKSKLGKGTIFTVRLPLTQPLHTTSNA